MNESITTLDAPPSATPTSRWDGLKSSTGIAKLLRSVVPTTE
jgi:hypothetical protein